MSLYINDPEALRLAQALSEATGESLAQALTIAIKERMTRVQLARPSGDELLAIGDRCAAYRLATPAESFKTSTLLYDQHGLPM